MLVLEFEKLVLGLLWKKMFLIGFGMALVVFRLFRGMRVGLKGGFSFVFGGGGSR